MHTESRTVLDRAEMATAPGSRQSFDLATVREADGRVVVVPVEIVAGAHPGPRLVCAAGIHGDEIEGIVALQELSKRIDTAQLRGTLVLVKVVNPSAFGAAQRRTPADDNDLNRVFPGRADGSFSERHAERLFTEIIAGSDFLFTLHGAQKGSILAPYVEVPLGDDDVCRRSMAAAEASGIERIFPLLWHPGVLPAAANRAGIPSMEAEIGGNGSTDEHGWQRYVATCLDLLRHLQMLEVPPPRRETRLVVIEPLTAARGGLWRRRVALSLRAKPR